METARTSGDKESLRHVLSLAATLANLRGEYEKANEYLEESGSLAPAPKETERQEEVPRGGRLVVAMATPLGDIDPVNMELVEEQEILANVFETLLVTDLEGNLVPALCEKWEVSDDGTSVFFTLRESARFQNGQALTAQAIKRSFERSIRVARELPPGLAAIRGAADFAKGVDPKTVEAPDAVKRLTVRPRGWYRGEFDRMVRDDDMDYPLLALHVLEEYGPDFTTAHVGRAWELLLPYLQVYTAERATARFPWS
jgi:ABC-type transport system substrate-binding protein